MLPSMMKSQMEKSMEMKWKLDPDVGEAWDDGGFRFKSLSFQRTRSSLGRLL